MCLVIHICTHPNEKSRDHFGGNIAHAYSSYGLTAYSATQSRSTGKGSSTMRSTLLDQLLQLGKLLPQSLTSACGRKLQSASVCKDNSLYMKVVDTCLYIHIHLYLLLYASITVCRKICTYIQGLWRQLTHTDVSDKPNTSTIRIT